MTTFLSNREIYESVICGIVPQVRERLWIATANIKDMYVEPPSRASRACQSTRRAVRLCLARCILPRMRPLGTRA